MVVVFCDRKSRARAYSGPVAESKKIPPSNERVATTREEARLAALHRYDILDTPPEEDFDDLARLAAQV